MMANEEASEVTHEAPIATDTRFVLGIDTCGPTGSVALGRLLAESVSIIRQVGLEGRNYSSTLIAAIEDLLTGAGIRVADLEGIVAVNGPGSFTGVRIGLSAVKGLAESAGTPVVAISRLVVLARTAGVDAAALDAHRNEVYLRVGDAETLRELLAGVDELVAIGPGTGPIAVCDEAAAHSIRRAWPCANVLEVAAPTAAAALSLCGPNLANGPYADLELLDGHYLRRSDAEIFGDAQAVPASGAQ